MNLIKAIKRYFTEKQETRFRDRRAFYASELTKDARDIYWKLTGEVETNPGDIKGKIRMSLGKWIEVGLVREVLANLHFFGIHAIGADGQAQIGGSDVVKVDGSLDGLLVERQGDDFGKPWVLEIKTKYGYGADLFKSTCNPEESYLAQLGYYLKDLSAKGVTDRGLFLFLLVSDRNFAEIITISCEYNAGNDTITAYEAESLNDGEKKQIHFELCLTPVLERLKKIEECVVSGTLPPQEHFYKKPLTEEFLDEQSDKAIRDAIDGVKVLGSDWQILYSSFKDLHLKAEGTTLGHSDEEIALLQAHYLKRHPKSKIGTKKVA